jgi:plastocyanin
MFKHTLIAITAGAFLAAGAASAAPTQNASLLIRHQARGCHAWSIDGGAFRAPQTLTLTRGSRLTITNNDIMSHKLVKLSGPTLTFAPARMSHNGASVKLTFTHAGVYRFTTKAGEDYPAMAMMKTVGEDNVLRLTVRVP